MKRLPSSVFILVLFFPVLSCPAKGMEQWLSEHEAELHGFADMRAGVRLGDDPHEKEASLGELRLQLDLFKYLDRGSIKLKGDVVADTVAEEVRPELREANLLYSPLDFMDVRLGRQILTWGTGDLLFINDLFPKDWESFFIGRDSEYLKLPNDAVKVSLFFDLANIDLVYVPIFNASTYIDGSRVSYWNPLLGRIAGNDFILNDHERNSFPDDSEYTARLYRNIGSMEMAFYFYSGFWKTPEGLDPVAGRLIYPKLNEYGTSARWPVWGGIANLEAGYYDSRDDRDGGDPLLRNSEWRLLAGYERELARDFTGGMQYYLEWMEDYDAYRSSAGQYLKDEYRHLFTLRLTKLLFRQNLLLAFFVYYSPSDEDGYLRLNSQYKLTDQWTIAVGGNFFSGNTDHTFFGQFEENDNVYAGLTRTF
ncbi:MAG: hypothetical protein SCH71_10455 [Desulfobulbaceae bacterium]|nr:hypothetical protein [Desulfobulbaceae bacterium]